MGFFDKIFGVNKDLAQDSTKDSTQDSHDSRESIIDSAQNLAQDSPQDSSTKDSKSRTPRKNSANPNIPTPNQNELQKWVDEWHKGQAMENYRQQESALYKLFHHTYPRNDDLDEVLVKVATLNDFYSTNIYNIFAVARHILDITDIDLRLQNGDEYLVNEIANVAELGKNFYSFATKFCSHHNEIDYAIYDSYVEKMLIYFQKRDKFGNFKKDDLRDYGRFKKALNDFKIFYALDCNLKELDRYLWQAGKSHFARYGKE